MSQLGSSLFTGTAASARMALAEILAAQVGKGQMPGWAGGDHPSHTRQQASSPKQAGQAAPAVQLASRAHVFPSARHAPCCPPRPAWGRRQALGWPLPCPHPFSPPRSAVRLFAPAHAQGPLGTEFAELAQSMGWADSLPAWAQPVAGLQ